MQRVDYRKYTHQIGPNLSKLLSQPQVNRFSILLQYHDQNAEVITINIQQIQTAVKNNDYDWNLVVSIFVWLFRRWLIEASLRVQVSAGNNIIVVS